MYSRDEQFLFRNSGNKHQNDPLVSAETIRHSSTHITTYIARFDIPEPSRNSAIMGIWVIFDDCDTMAT